MSQTSHQEFLAFIERLRQSESFVVSRAWGVGDRSGKQDADLKSKYGEQWIEFLKGVSEMQASASRKFAICSSNDASDVQTEGRGASPNSSVWWVTQRGLEQATDAHVARLKAGWFGQHPVHDLCGGLGGDGMQLLERGDLHIVERDPLTAAMLSENLGRHCTSGHEFSVHVCNLSDYSFSDQSYLHLDPDRRVEGRVARDPSRFSPTWHEVCAMLVRSAGAVVKYAPATQIPSEPVLQGDLHRAWIEFAGSVREQDLLWGDACELAGLEPGRRSAHLIRSDGGVFCYESVGKFDGRADLVQEVSSLDGSWLIDPRGVMRAAGLTEEFAVTNGCAFLSGPSGFLSLSSHKADRVPELKTFCSLGRVEWIGACDDRKLRKELRRRDCYPQTIKVRGTDHNPNELVKRYRSCGDRPIRLWIGRIGKRVFAAITDIA